MPVTKGGQDTSRSMDVPRWLVLDGLTRVKMRKLRTLVLSPNFSCIHLGSSLYFLVYSISIHLWDSLSGF